ncbi:MAG: hypothetical protein WBC44_14615, partial [Planctomycetaceae bacterium]
MTAHSLARRGAAGSLDGYPGADLLLCELAELCDRYVEGSARRQWQFDLWASRAVLGVPWRRLAARSDRGERTVRR